MCRISENILKRTKALKPIFKKSSKVLLVVLLLFQGYVLARLYLFASCVIPTYSMAPTLLGGDYIITSLQIPGRRIWGEDGSGRSVIHREKGVRGIRKNDIVVFNFPYSSNANKMKLESKLYYCKRCVGVPGEIYEWKRHLKKFHVYLPCSGDELSIDSLNYNDYRKCIEYETGNRLKCLGNVILLGDSVIHTYRFCRNYYFMRGDNATDSYDSRFWGILPEDFILGVGQFIWFSRDKKSGKLRWKRMLRRI
ncbi:signal peptidase I [uncultured Bacteroides sp.]|uniref:signal peptidase I n=1 Tax=uncultured Bacteroides sp. TaxID=162156 RepID=UPI0026753892|nr:signal peptidase I [uncultured Bacteroides sp.]